MSKPINIVIQGCVHGELNKCYAEIKKLKKKIDLVIINGDFQAIRTKSDLEYMSVPNKYKKIGNFPDYYNGNINPPYLTIIIGGNHEASNYFSELYYGGWIAPKIYYLGRAGCIIYKGIRISGLSGIYSPYHYNWGHGETFSLVRYNKNINQSSVIRSCYHIRQYDVFKLYNLSGAIDLFLSHDWPAGIEHFGNLNWLLSVKKHFKSDVLNNSLGSLPGSHLFQRLRPNFWFSSHMHVRYQATVNHSNIPKPTSDSFYQLPENNKLGNFYNSSPILSSAVVNSDEIDLDDDLNDDLPLTKNNNENNTDSNRHNNDNTLSKVSSNEEHASKRQKVNHSNQPKEDKNQPIDPIFLNEIIPKNNQTHFLALDKCLPRRKFFELIPFTPSEESTKKFKALSAPVIQLNKQNKQKIASQPPSRKSIQNLLNSEPTPSTDKKLFSNIKRSENLLYDPEWLAITRALHPYLSTTYSQTIPSKNEFDTKIKNEIEKEKIWVYENITSKGLLGIPVYYDKKSKKVLEQETLLDRPTNVQTDLFCRMLQVSNKFSNNSNNQQNFVANLNKDTDKNINNNDNTSLSDTDEIFKAYSDSDSDSDGDSILKK